MTSQRGKQAIAIHILINISRSKGNLAMKFGQLIEYNMGYSIVMELHFGECSRSLNSKFGRKEFYQFYLLKWFYTVNGEDYCRIFYLSHYA